MPITANFFSIKISKSDLFVQILIFISLAILPLFQEYTWISTTVIIPILAIFLFLSERTLRLYADKFFKMFFIVFFIALLSIIFVNDLPAYLAEIKKLFGVFVLFVIGSYILKNNINNIWFLYLTLLAKFFLMIYLTYKSGVIATFDYDVGRLQSGSEFGINANAYGYFAFISFYAVGAVMIIRKHVFYKLLFLCVLFPAIYINILAASRAGLFFSILTASAVIIATTYKTWKGLYLKIGVIVLLLTFLIIRKFSDLENLFVFQRYIAFAESGEDLRLIILKEGVATFLRNPFGIGAGQFPFAMLESKVVRVLAVPHNSYLLVSTNYGILALFAFIGMFYFYFKNSLKIINNEELSIRRYGIYFLSFGLLFFAYNFFYDMILNLYIMFMFYIMNYHQNYIIKRYVQISKN